MSKMAVLLLAFISLVCEAQQKVPVEEGAETTVIVATKVLNRIAVEHDRILTVKGVSGQFELDKDTELGQVFLKPIATENEERIHLFLMTEKGHTYPLSLTLKDVEAQSILLMPLEDGLGAEWEQSSFYEQRLRTFVQAMANHKEGQGIVQDNPKKVKSLLPKIKGVHLKLLEAYHGHQLEGLVLEVSNTGKETLYLTEQDFMEPGVRAICLLNPVVPAKGKTRVYKVN